MKIFRLTILKAGTVVHCEQARSCKQLNPLSWTYFTKQDKPVKYVRLVGNMQSHSFTKVRPLSLVGAK